MSFRTQVKTTISSRNSFTEVELPKHSLLSIKNSDIFQCLYHISVIITLSLFFFLLISVSQVEILKLDHERLQIQIQNQKFTPADVESINREKRELQQTISSLTKTLEEAEQLKWNEEIALAKAKERVSLHPAPTARLLLVHLHWCLTRPLPFFSPQEEAKLSEYHKLARKLQLIPVSAKNARGHDFQIRQFNCGSSSIVQHNTETQARVSQKSGSQFESWFRSLPFKSRKFWGLTSLNLCIEPSFVLQMRLRKLISDVEEENSQLADMKLSLEESCEQVPSSVSTKSQGFVLQSGAKS